MKVQLSIVGSQRTVSWPEGWPIPRVDEEVTLADGDIVYVHTVVWYPAGDEHATQPDEPFVYIVLSDRPRL